MKKNGFSLVELIIVIAIMAIIMSIATVKFNSWQRKAQIESQNRILFATLNQARVDAMQHKQPRSVVLSTNGYGYTFKTYTSENESRSAGKTAQAQTVTYQITETSGPSDKITQFDVRGFTNDTGIFQINPIGTLAQVDCIFVNSGQTKMGKNTNGGCTIQ